MARIVLPCASLDFDPTEVSVPWSVLHDAGHEVFFATSDAARAWPDEIMLTGAGLDPWAFIPVLRGIRGVGRVLGADARARAAYARLEQDARFLAPVAFRALSAADWDGVVLPGGHRARGIRPYLEDLHLRAFVSGMFDAGKPVGAICHGTVVAARATSAATGRSVLHGRKTTSLTWAQERLATRIARVTRFWDPTYYRTYTEAKGEPAGYRGVEAEVTRALASSDDYRDVPRDDPDRGIKTDGLHRDGPDDPRPAFVVRDGCYVSARWPGDAHTFAKTFADALREGGRAPR
jgi:putative intracellular protease/amidase